MRSQTDKPAFFLTATDTGVGKTIITAGLLQALHTKRQRVGVMKPIETGVDFQRPEHSDTERLRRLLSPPPSFDSVCLYAFPQPLAPFECARKAGTTIDMSHILSSYNTLLQHYSGLLVEGAGGVFTPITANQTMRDLMVSFHLPVIVVGGTYLGGVNHLLLTLEALERAKIKTCGVVLNDSVLPHPTPYGHQQRLSTIGLIRELSSVPVFGPLEYEKIVQTDWPRGVGMVANHPEIQRLAEHLIGTVP
jgi:dethiobiotin synthetase